MSPSWSRRTGKVADLATVDLCLAASARFCLPPSSLSLPTRTMPITRNAASPRVRSRASTPAWAFSLSTAQPSRDRLVCTVDCPAEQPGWQDRHLPEVVSNVGRGPETRRADAGCHRLRRVEARDQVDAAEAGPLPVARHQAERHRLVRHQGQASQQPLLRGPAGAGPAGLPPRHARPGNYLRPKCFLTKLSVRSEDSPRPTPVWTWHSRPSLSIRSFRA